MIEGIVIAGMMIWLVITGPSLGPEHQAEKDKAVEIEIVDKEVR